MGRAIGTAQAFRSAYSEFILQVKAIVFADGCTGYECEKGVNNDPKVFHLRVQKFKSALTEMEKTGN